MLNIIKADLYRIVRGKGIYITLALLLFVIVLQVAANETGTIGVNVGVTEEISEEAEEEVFTVATTINKTMATTDNLIYFILPFIIFIAAVDFSTGTVKNVLSSGKSRAKYFISKLILSWIVCIGLFLIYILTSVIIAAMLNGVGEGIDSKFINTALKVFLLNTYQLIAVTSAGVFLSFVTKKVAMVNGFYIALNMIPSLLTLTLIMISDNFKELFKYNIVTNMGVVSNLSMGIEIPKDDFIKIIMTAFVYIFVSVVGGLAIFGKSGIK